MDTDIFLKVLVAQIVSASIILFVLKKVLDRNLIELTIRRLETLPFAEFKNVNSVTIVSHKKLNAKYQERVFKTSTRYFGTKVTPVLQIDKRLWGGAILHINENIYDFSLNDRLRQAMRKR